MSIQKSPHLGDATQRFSNRVENYVKYRPGYSPRLIEVLKEGCQLTADCVVADIGSGTGHLTELFLKHGNLVYAVEPNREMREAADRSLRRYPNYRSVEGRAESTGLADNSVDFVAVGRALHWFDLRKAFQEFCRILRSAGWVVVVRLQRKNSSSFMVEYDQLLLTYAKDHETMSARKEELKLRLEAAAFEQRSIEEKRLVDFEGLVGQTLSYSITPSEGRESYHPMRESLRRLFERHEKDGRVTFEYAMEVQYGRCRQWTREP